MDVDEIQTKEFHIKALVFYPDEFELFEKVKKGAEKLKEKMQ